MRKTWISKVQRAVAIIYFQLLLSMETFPTYCPLIILPWGIPCSEYMAVRLFVNVLRAVKIIPALGLNGLKVWNEPFGIHKPGLEVFHVNSRSA